MGKEDITDTEWRDAYGKAKEENRRNTVTKLQSQKKKK